MLGEDRKVHGLQHRDVLSEKMLVKANTESLISGKKGYNHIILRTRVIRLVLPS